MAVSSKRSWFRRRRTIALAIGLIAFGGLLYLLLSPSPFVTPPFEIGGTIQVVVLDDQDNRIEGASVTSHGLRAVQDQGSWYSWLEDEHGQYESAITDENGLAELNYPKWVNRGTGLIISTLCLMVSHPDYCSNREVECPVDSVGRVKPIHRIHLKRGGRLRATLRRENGDEPFGEVYGRASADWMNDAWKDEGPGIKTSPVFSPGPHVVRIIDRTNPQKLQFSDPIVFDAIAGQTEDREIIIRPGVRFHGRLDVPQPVQNGYVILQVTDFSVPSPTTHDQCLIWSTWTKVAENGEFEFPSLPPTSSVSLHAWCDGHVSRLPKPASIPAYALAASSNHTLPQFYQLKEDSTVHSIPMEKTATCEATVTDSSGRPLEGIKIEFYPNILIGINGNTLFGAATASEQYVPKTYSSAAEQLRETMRMFHYNKESSPGELHVPYSGVSDAQGQCHIANLPAYSPETLHVDNDKWVLKGLDRPPFRGRLQVELKRGEASKVDVVLVPKPALTAQMLKAPQPTIGRKILTNASQLITIVRQYFGW